MPKPLNMLLMMMTTATIAVAHPAGAEHFCDDPPALTLLTGEGVTASGAGSEGFPTDYRWYITPPGATPPSDPDGSGPLHSITVDAPGLWSVALVADYGHESDVGGLWRSETCITIEVSSVVASLELGALQVPTDEELLVNGHASVWAPGVAPLVEWQVDGQPLGSCNGGSPPDSPADLECEIPANWLGTGWHTAGLALTDPSSGQTSLSTAQFEVIEVVPLSVDFAWNPSEPDPDQSILFMASVLPTMDESEFTQVVWDLGDGSVYTYDQCPLPFASCLDRPHSYSSDGWFNVTVTVHTIDETAFMTHDIEVGDPVPPPTASFTPSPASPLLYQTTSLSFDGSCTGDCQWSWSFGDGTHSAADSPLHIWAVPDTYTVRLTVSNLSGSDVTTRAVQVGSCWTPASPVQTGSCYGGPVSLAEASGTDWRWNTGDTGPSIPVFADGSYWVNVDNGAECWGHAPTTVVLTNCGDAGGDTNLDSITDTADLTALIAELTDGDGDTVVGAGGGDLTAPGGDVTRDFRLRTDDLLTVLVEIFD